MSKLIRPVTRDEIAAYRIAGVVLLRGILDLGAVARPLGGQQHVEEAVVGEAGLRVGVPQRVVQTGGALQGELQVRAADQELGDGQRGREGLGGQPAGAQLGVQQLAL